MTDQVAPPDTRSAILVQARRLFLTLGYHKTTMRNIAEAAGISTGPLYFHFHDKAEVFFTICSEAFDCLTAEFCRIARAERPAGERLRNIFQAYKAFYYREPQLFAMMHLATDPLSGIGLPERLAESLLQKGIALVGIMEEIIREGISRQELRPVDPVRLAIYLYSVAEGIFVSNRMGILLRQKIDMDEMIDAAIELVGAGMINPDRAAKYSD
ncbi:MAG: TetR/AcrR family transcriptional regulator [Negativicutes bacterium]